MRTLYRTVALFCMMFLVAVAAIAIDGLMDRQAYADAVVVPGNTVSPQGIPSDRLAARLDMALFAYNTKLAPLIIVSGATGEKGVDEATAMARYLEARGVPRQAILLDSQGADTAATAMNASERLHRSDLDTVLIASQYFHVTRMRLALQRAGLHVSGSLHARHFELRDLYSLPREVAGLISYPVGMKEIVRISGGDAKAG